MEPPAAVSIAHFHEVYRPVMLGRPIAVVDLAYGPVHQYDAPRTKQRRHSPVGRPDIPIEVTTVAVCEHTLEVTPLFHHARQEFRSPRIECRVKFHRYAQRSWRRH